MEVNMQTEADISDKNIKARATSEDEHVSKKLKLSEPLDKELESKNNVSKDESNDTEMPLLQENPSKASSSYQRTSKSSKDVDHKQASSNKKDDDSDEEDLNLDPHQPTPGFTYPLEHDASDMLDECYGIVDGRYPTVTERYFTPYYQLDIPKPGDDICLLVHSNRICMFTLAPSHTIYQENKKIVKCDYQVSEKLNRLKNKVSGKAKHGAQSLQNNSNICRLECEDGSVHIVKCCIIGKLVEVNERLVEEPELLKKLPHQGGYIAIALPNLKHLDRIKSSLLDQASYEQALQKRKEKLKEETSEKSSDTLLVEGESKITEVKNDHNNLKDTVQNEESKDTVNANENGEKIENMEVVES